MMEHETPNMAQPPNDPNQEQTQDTQADQSPLVMPGPPTYQNPTPPPPPKRRNWGKPFAVGIFAVLFVMSMFYWTGKLRAMFWHSSSDHSVYASTDWYESTQDFYDVDYIDIDMPSDSQISIEPWDGDSVQVYLSGEIPDNAKVDTRQNGKKLSISLDDNFWNFGFQNTFSVVIFMPNDLDRLKLDLVSGSVDVKVNVRDLEIDTVSSELFITSVSKRMEIDTVSGSAYISDSQAERIKFDTVSGDFSFSGIIEREIDVDGVSGDVDVSLSRSSGVTTVSFDTVSGTLYNDAELKEQSHGDISYDSVSGDLSVSYYD